jgi:hypothetical protein
LRTTVIKKADQALNRSRKINVSKDLRRSNFGVEKYLKNNCKDTQVFGAKDVEELAKLGESHVIFQEAYAMDEPVLNPVSAEKEQRRSIK